jgi:hypothetical protein
MDRAQVQFVDLVLGLFVLLALVVLFPVYDQFAQSISTAAGPLTTLILRLIYPALIIGLVLSIGVSARRSGGIT